MPEPTQLTSQRAVCWLLRAALVVAVTFGLFAMHTLPAVTAAPSMAASENTVHSAVSSVGAMTPSKSTAVSRLSQAEPAMGCSGSHGACLAVLRSFPTGGLALAVVATRLAAEATDVAEPTSQAVASRAPPDVCLDRLCISRT